MLRSRAPPVANNSINGSAAAIKKSHHRNDNNNSTKSSMFPFRHPDTSSTTTNTTTNNTTRSRDYSEEISVSNLRKLYSSLLEELAPLHHELGTTSAPSTSSHENTTAKSNNNSNSKNANYRWKNNGTITVDGADDTGYDYSYTPDDSVHSWRLGGLRSATTAKHHQQHHSSFNAGPKKITLSRKLNVKLGKKGGRRIEGGITGGDWSKDGVRRYHTKGVTSPLAFAASASAAGSNVMKDDVNKDNDVNNKVNDATDGAEELISVQEDAATVQLDERFSIQDDDDDEVEEYDDEIMFDVNILSPVPSVDVDNNEDSKEQAVIQSDDCLMPSMELPSPPIVHTAPQTKSSSSSSKTTKMIRKKQTAASIMKSSSSSSSRIMKSNNSSSSSPPPLSTFESLYNHHNPTTTTWRLRSAYMPTSPHEKQLLQSLGSSSYNTTTTAADNNTNNNNFSNKANSIMSGINNAQNSEVRVCHSLKRIAEILCLSERRKGRKFIGLVNNSNNSSNNSSLLQNKYNCNVTMVESSSDEDDDDDDELEVSEAVFAYFCEKNILPLLIDSFLTRPPMSQLSVEDDEDDDDSDDDEEWWKKDKKKKKHDPSLESTSLFSGVSWAASVKSQILQTMSMLLLNTSSPLSLAYLLSNNYMNELIMGMLPLSQWREEALDEMLPPFVTLLRGLVMKLRGEEGRGLIPLLMCQRAKMGGGGNSEAGEEKEEEGSETYLPLLYAAVQVFCYSPGSSLHDADGCLVRTTAMNAILNLCRITSPDVRAVFVGEGLTDASLPCTTKSAPPPNDFLSSMLPSPSQSPSPSSLSVSSFPNATVEQQVLFPYICSNLQSCYHRSVRLMMTSIHLDKSSKHNKDAKAEATQRNVDLASSQFSELQYWLGFLDDLLSCEIRVWNVRLVEWIMREVVVGTILLHWNRALRVVGAVAASDEGNDTSKAAKKNSLEYCKAKAEIRVSIVFLTQLFAMVSYRPLIRLAGAAVLHPKYPIAWCGGDDNLFDSSDRTSRSKDFFQVTPIINAIVSNKESDLEGGDNAAATGGGEEADAGAGVKDDAFVPNLHRASLLEMLSGDETIIASMLLATILENDALDDKALEKLGVLPSPDDDVQVSPFEEALAKFLTTNTEEPRQLTTSPRKYIRSTSGDEAQGNAKRNETLSVAVEFVSSLGLMLMERIIFHTWTEGGECLDVVPFDHYYKSSKFVQALTSSLTYFASFAMRLTEDDSLEEYFQAEFNSRYVSTEANNDSIHSGGNHSHYENSTKKMVCCIQDYHPSNFIDDANVLLQSSAPPSIESAEEKAAKCAVRLTLHLRSLVGCMEEFYSRFTALTGHRPNTNKHWYGEAEVLSFCIIEEADELLLSIGGVQVTRIPDVGTDIDLRGRKSFPCSLQTNHKRRRGNKGLILVVDPSEIYVARCKKGDFNRCTILAVVPLTTIIASASAGEILHIICPMAEVPIGTEDGILKDGRLSLCFNNVSTSISAKEILDKYCAALENRAAMDIDELLEKCLEVGDKILTTKSKSSSQRREARDEEAWADFQQA